MNILVTPRLLLRPFTMGDLDDMIALYSDPEVMRYIKSIPTPEEIKASLEQRIVNFDQHGWGMFAVIERREKRFIGKCGLQPLPGTDMIEIGYQFKKSAWGKGYATEASKLVLQKAFSDWGLDSIVAVADPKHTASTHIMEKLGMQFVRYGEFHQRNCALYSIEKVPSEPKRPYRESFDFFREFATVS